MNLIRWAESGRLPDWLLRIGIRRLLARRLRQEQSRQARGDEEAASFLSELHEGPIAIETRAANEQHYEVPAEFFARVLGPRLKYSCCWFPSAETDVAAAEEEMLRLTCQRAGIADGMDILELGCGWGSLALWLAERFPHCRITAVSNSHGQRRFIEQRCRERGITRLKVVTADMRDFAAQERHDRVLSIEMFEHMRNYRLLLERIAGWLRPDGKLFVHVFSHRELCYPFSARGDSDWMAQHFFTGGLMPSRGLLTRFGEHLQVEREWHESGLHYAWTCECWLKNLDRHRAEILRLFQSSEASSSAAVRLQRWRMFFLACAELFRYRDGAEWGVSHYLLSHAHLASPAFEELIRTSDVQASQGNSRFLADSR